MFLPAGLGSGFSAQELDKVMNKIFLLFREIVDVNHIAHVKHSFVLLFFPHLMIRT
jgi:hypothetical protein